MATRKPTAPAPPLKRPATLDHLRKKEPREESVAIIVSDSAAVAYQAAKEAAGRARTVLEREAADTALAEAQAELDEATVWVRVRDIGRRAYENLVKAHPPTATQLDELRRLDKEAVLRWNPETFPPALVAACMIEPAISTAEAAELLDEWNVEDSSRLLVACETVCQRSRAIDLGKGYGPTLGS